MEFWVWQTDNPDVPVRAVHSLGGTVSVGHEPFRLADNPQEALRLLQIDIADGWKRMGKLPVVFYGRHHAYKEDQVRPERILVPHAAVYALNRGNANGREVTRADRFEILAVAERLSRLATLERTHQVWGLVNFLASATRKEIRQALALIRRSNYTKALRCIVVRTCNARGNTLMSTSAVIQEVSGGYRPNFFWPTLTPKPQTDNLRAEVH